MSERCQTKAVIRGKEVRCAEIDGHVTAHVFYPGELGEPAAEPKPVKANHDAAPVRCAEEDPESQQCRDGMAPDGTGGTEPAAEPQPRSTAWLIERGGLCLGICEYRLRWVTFTDESALRFSRRSDAYGLLETLKWAPFKLFDYLQGAFITEHGWWGGGESNAAPAPAALLCPKCRQAVDMVARLGREMERADQLEAELTDAYAHVDQLRADQRELSAELEQVRKRPTSCLICGQEKMGTPCMVHLPTGVFVCNGCMDKIAELEQVKAERDRMRDALRRLRDNGAEYCECDHSDDNCCNKVGEHCAWCICEAALGEKGQQ